MKAVVLSLCMLLVCAVVQAAAVTAGAVRAEVIAAYGPPKGSTQAGAKEILVYVDGRVVLENGLVTRIDMKPPPVPPPPVAPPASAAPPVVITPPVATVSEQKAAPPAPVEWLTDFEAAKNEATAKHKRILALFTGSDWCPSCMQFESEVAHDVDFLRVTRISYVLLKLDYPQNTAQPPALQKQNQALRLQYGVSSYPTLFMISADGQKAVRVDTRRDRMADTIVEFYLQAVGEARANFDRPKSSWWPF